MRSLFRVLLAVVLLPATPLHAAAADALAPGSWSAQFSVQPDFMLGSFQGSLLSLKRHLGGDRAIRFGLSFGISDRRDDQVTSFVGPSFGNGQTLGEDGNLWSIGLTTSYLWYSSAAAPIHAYWGGGPFFSLSGSGADRTSTHTTTFPTSDSATVRIESDGWQAGLGGALGVEWLVAKRVGLFAEYGSSLSYVSFSDTRTSTTTGSGGPTHETMKRDHHRVEFGGSGARLGLSAYF